MQGFRAAAKNLILNQNLSKALTQSITTIHLLDVFVPSVWFPQLASGKLKSPARTRIVDLQVFVSS